MGGERAIARLGLWLDVIWSYLAEVGKRRSGCVTGAAPVGSSVECDTNWLSVALITPWGSAHDLRVGVGERRHRLAVGRAKEAAQMRGSHCCVGGEGREPKPLCENRDPNVRHSADCTAAGAAALIESGAKGFV